MRPLYTRRNIIIGLALLLLTLSAFVYLISVNIRRVARETEKVNNSLLSLRVLENVMDDMQDLESGQRGFLISHDERFLEPYHISLKDLKTDTAGVHALMLIYPQRAATLEKLLMYVRDKARFASIAIGLVQNNQPDSANRRVRSGIGKAAMDSIRAILSRIENEDRILLRNSNNERQIAARSSASWLILVVSLLIIGLVILSWQIFRDIRHKEAGEKKIKYLATLTEKTSDAIISTDLKGHILSWNEGAEKMFGYPRAEVLGKPCDEVTQSDHLGKAIMDLQGDSATKTNFTVESMHQGKNGERIYCLASITVLRTEEGTPSGLVMILRDITSRKHAEELLEKFNEELNKRVKEQTDQIKNSEEKYRIIVETSQEGIWMLDSNHNTVFVNDRLAQMLGYSKEEMLKMKIWDFMDEEGRRISEEALNRRKNGAKEGLEFRYIRKDGSVLWTLLSTAPIMVNGEYRGALAMIVDITERKKAIDDIRRSHESFELISKTTNDAIWEWNLESGELWANETHQQLYGLTLNDPVPSETMWAARMHPEDRQVILDRQKRTLASDKNVFISEYRFNVEGKGYRNLYDRCYIVRDHEGRPTRMTGSMMDITERKNAEAALRAVEETRKLIMDSALDAIICMDTEGLVTVWTPQSEKVFGWSEEEVMGKKLSDLIIPPHYRNAHENGLTHYMATGEAHMLNRLMEFTAVNRQGVEFPIEISITPFRQNQKDFFCAFIRDISQRKRAEEQLIKEKILSDTTINSLPGVFYLFDETGHFLRWNKNFENVLGYSAQELQVVNPLEMIVPEEREAAARKMSEIYASGSGEMEAHFLTRDGRRVPYFFMGRRIVYNSVPSILGTGIDISELKKAQQTIIENEGRLRTIINSDPQCIKLTDREGKLLEMNPAGLSMIEADSMEQVRGNNVVNIVDEEYRPAFRQLITDVFNDKSGSLLFRITGLKGTPRWLETHAVPMKDAEGRIQALLGVTMDVTFKKLAEEELRRNEEKYRTLVEQAVDAIALYDEEGKILDVNTGAAVLLGYSKNELMKMSLPQILTPEEIREKPVAYATLARGESTVKQRRMKRKDGSVIETEVRSQQLPDGRFLSFIRDLTERIKAQQQIEAEKRLSDKLIDSLPGIFYLYDDKPRFLRWNKQFEVVSGYTAEEVAVMHPTDFFEGKDKEYIRERAIKVFTEGSADAEAYFVSKDGSRRLYHFKAVRLIYNGLTCLLGTAIDIEDRKKAEQELALSNETLRKLTEHLQNIREEERSHIAREIHDELGQQLTVLKMDVSWLNKKIESGDEKVRGRLKELVEMIDNTVKSVRKISSELRPSMLDDLGLAAAIEWQGQEFEKRSGIPVRTTLEVGEVKLQNNIAITLFRIFQESLTNIARHSGAKAVAVHLRIDGNGLDMMIQDDGRGFVVKGIEGKRTLGILGMKERAAIINGKYSIDSVPGKGTTVRVHVPLPVVV